MADQTAAAPPLRLPLDLMEVARVVAEEFKEHEACARSRALSEAAEGLRERARLLREARTSDPLTEALRSRCHTEGGAIHAAASVVAAVALEEIARQLDPREETP